MKISYPEKDGKASDLKFSNRYGKYLISHFNTWHGGVHIEGSKKPIQSIADGRIIAYRFSETYEKLKKTDIFTDEKETEEQKSYEYSNCFLLMQHDIKLSKSTVENKGTDKETTKSEHKYVTFYSMYHHLMPLNEIVAAKLDLPKFMSKHEIKVIANEDFEVPTVIRKGLNARILKGNLVNSGTNGVKVVIPKGTIVNAQLNELGEIVIKKNANGAKYVRVQFTDVDAVFYNNIYVYINATTDNKDDTYTININTDKGKWQNKSTLTEEEKNARGARVRDKTSKGKVTAIIPNKKSVTIKKTIGNWHVIDGYEGFSHKDNFEEKYSFDENKITKNDITACDIPIKAGQHLGYTGALNGEVAPTYHAVQLDVFMAEGAKDFLENKFKAGKEEDKKFIKIPEGTILKKSIKTNVVLVKNLPVTVTDIRGIYAKIKVVKQIEKTLTVKGNIWTSDNDSKDKTKKGYSKTNGYHILNFSNVNKAFDGLLTKGESKLFWVKTPNKLTRIVKFKPKEAGKEYWVELKDLFTDIKLLSKKITIEVPKSVGYFDSFINMITGNEPPKIKKEITIPYPAFVPAKKGEKTTVANKITTAYIIIPDNETDVDEELCKEAIIDLHKAKQKEINNKKYIQVTCTYPINTTMYTQKGWIEKPSDETLKTDVFSAYNWDKFGFKTIDAGDEYIYDIKDIRKENTTASNFIKTLWKTLQVTNDEVLDIFELNAAYKTLETQYEVAKMVGNHKSEWAYKPQEIADEITKFYDFLIAEEKPEVKADLEKLKKEKLEGIKGQVEKLMWWNEASKLTYTKPVEPVEPTPKPKYDFGVDPEPQKASPSPSPSPQKDVVPLATKTTAPQPDTNPTGDEPVATKKEEKDQPPERMFPSTDIVHHFHPIAWVTQMKRVFGGGVACETLIWGEKVSCKFRAKVIQIATNLWGEDKKIEMANNLMAVFAWESGQKFKSNVPNMANSGGTGLIQFMPSTIASLLNKKESDLTIEKVTNYWGKGKTLKRVKEFADMSELRQLDYVEKYFKSLKGKSVEFVDFYLQVLYPASMGKPDNHVVFSKDGTGLLKTDRNYQGRINAYSQNKGFDTNKKYGNNDGMVTKAEIKKGVQRFLDEGKKHTNNCNNGSCTLGDEEDTNIIENGVTLNFVGKSSKEYSLSVKTKNILKEVGEKSGNNKIVITSTARTPYDQARIMYNNCNDDLQEQRDTYKLPGQKVIDVYVEKTKKKKTRSEIITAMEKKIKSLGASSVSSHCADQSIINTFDISYANLKDKTKFWNEMKKRVELDKILNENKCYHIQIKQ